MCHFIVCITSSALKLIHEVPLRDFNSPRVSAGNSSSVNIHQRATFVSGSLLVTRYLAYSCVRLIERFELFSFFCDDGSWINCAVVAAYSRKSIDESKRSCYFMAYFFCLIFVLFLCILKLNYLKTKLTFKIERQINFLKYHIASRLVYRWVCLWRLVFLFCFSSGGCERVIMDNLGSKIKSYGRKVLRSHNDIRCSLFWFVHSQPSEVLEDNVVIIVSVVGVLVAVALDRLHFLHGVNAFAFNGSRSWG